MEALWVSASEKILGLTHIGGIEGVTRSVGVAKKLHCVDRRMQVKLVQLVADCPEAMQLNIDGHFTLAFIL